MINKKQLDILEKELNLKINDKIIDKFNEWEKLFIDYNSHTNLMSKNDIPLLFEKHVFDSLAILKWEKFTQNKTILDVGTGGGFPAVILAIVNPEIKIIANDSRIKKINFIKEIKEKIDLKNLEILYSRIEESKPLNVDLIVSRAVGKINNIWEISKKHLKKGGYFVIYKSKSTDVELKEFQVKYPKNKVEIIEYNLPLKEQFKRNLVIIKN